MALLLQCRPSCVVGLYDQWISSFRIKLRRCCSKSYKHIIVKEKILHPPLFSLASPLAAEVEGVKSKVLVWAKVTAGIKGSRIREAYEVVRGGITVDDCDVVSA
ncbi:hypothetical protein EJB05_46273 [Eragrostis curvula]|uniref:Uncharacterized protein n=1 Tax=Eragrostis curvula TaxID=38414 RepID=A0A5J9TMP0_9POAL|nr:hypothetical protein EJB05_46273 [Eragrostis curvula]